MEETKETLIKSANDLKINITKLNGEIVVDEECCTSIVLMLKNTGEIGTSFLGAHNPDILKALKKAINKYFRLLKKQLKTAPNEENIEVNKNEDLKEEIKLNNDNIENKNNTNTDNDNKDNKNKKSVKTTKNTNKKTTSKKSTSNNNSKQKNTTKNNKAKEKTAEEKSIDEVQEIIKDIKRMQDEYKNQNK